MQQFGVGIERQLGDNMMVSADVTASVTDNLAILRNLNQPLPGTLDANGPRPYPTFGSNIQLREMIGEGRYRGLDLGFQRRFVNGYSWRVSYTLGDARDNAPEHLGDNGGDRPQNGRDLDSWEAPSNFDIRHRIVSNFIAELPVRRRQADAAGRRRARRSSAAGSSAGSSARGPAGRSL